MFFINHNKRELHEERRTLIYQTDDMYNSYDSSNAHIYTEPQYMSIPVPNQQALQHYGDSNKYEEIENNQEPINNLMYNIGGLRKRHLSCIEEGDSDSLHSSSLPAAYEMMKDVDECFKKLVKNGSTNLLENVLNEDDETDQIAMIDESRVFELDYLDDLHVNDVTKREDRQETDYTKWNDDNFDGEMWQSTFSEPPQCMNTEMFTNIMTTSCYGALNSSFGSENFTEITHLSPMSTSISNKPEVIYATPKKGHRDSNRSYNSPSQSHTSSIYGLEQSFTGLMNTSLDLKCMTDSIDLNSTYASTPLNSENVGSDQPPDKILGNIKSDFPRNLLEDFDAVAEKCLSGAETGE